MLPCVTAVKLREWRGVKPVAAPAGVAITTRLRTSPEDERVLDLVAEHLGKLRRADLAQVCHPVPLAPSLDAEAKRQVRRDRRNARKKALTAQSSARWANAIIASNDAQYESARDAQHRHIVGLRVTIATIEKRLAQPTVDTLTPEQRRARRKARPPKGYATQTERFQKQRRLQRLRAELVRVTTDWDHKRVRVVEGGKRWAKTRHNLDPADITVPGWREEWERARNRIEALGSGDEPFGNLTLTVTPHGQVSLRLPKPLEQLANAPYGRYILSCTAVYSYRAEEWRARITGGQPVSYTITRTPGRAGRYLTAAWACPPPPSDILSSPGEVRACGQVVGVDLNDGHLALRRLDTHGNPVGLPQRIDFDLTGSSARRDAQVRHAVTRLIHHTARHGIATIAVEDLDFADARTVGRETMGHGARGKRFRKTVAGIPTAVFRDRLIGQAHRHGIDLFAVNPAYTTAWGEQHWRAPYKNVTRHEAAATGQGCEEPNPAHPAGEVRGTWAGQPLPRHRPPTASNMSNGVTVSSSVPDFGRRHGPGTIENGGEYSFAAVSSPRRPSSDDRHCGPTRSVEETSGVDRRPEACLCT
jgi:IS605 OrfB family transposase